MQPLRPTPAAGVGTREIPAPASGAPVDPFPCQTDEERRRRIAEAAYNRSLAEGNSRDGHATG